MKYLNNSFGDLYKVDEKSFECIKCKVVKYISKKSINYCYSRKVTRWYSESKSIYLIKSKFSQQELDFIDELFNNLDESNLTIIKGIINGRISKDSNKYL